MKTHLNICLTILVNLVFLTSSGQTVINTNKESGTVPKPVRLKDTTVYKIIIQTKDTFYFGSDKKMKVKESNVQLLNTFKTNYKSLDILLNGDSTLIMTLNLEITKQRNDTIPVYSIFDPTMIVQLYIEKIYTCDIKGLQINNYQKVQNYAYHKRLLTKLLDFKNQ